LTALQLLNLLGCSELKELPTSINKLTTLSIVGFVNWCQKNDKGKSEVDRKVPRKNTKKGSQKLFGHPLTLE
jgi:hypothetical protein